MELYFECPFNGCLERRPYLRDFLRHVRDVHTNDGPIFCTFGGCAEKRRFFRAFNTFRAHVYTKHPFANFTKRHHRHSDHPRVEPEPTASAVHDGQEPAVSFVEGDCDITDRTEEGTLPTMKDTAALWILKLREVHKLPTSTVVEVLQDVQSLYKFITTAIERTISPDMNHSQILEVMKSFENPFNGLESNHLQVAYFKKRLGYVEPKEITLGSIWKTCLRGHRRIKKRVKEGFIYVPILKTIETLLRNDSFVLSQVMSCHRRRSDEFLMDFCDGLVARNSAIFSKGGLEIMLSYDDMELCNPLGSKKKLHKMGMFYFTLGNISPEYRSSLRNIYLIAIARTSIIKRYSMNRILQYIIPDIKQLESGYDITINSSTLPIKFYGSLSTISADTPAACALGGFKESVSANKCCRQCHIKKCDLGKSHIEIPSQVRTLSDHLEKCQELEQSNNLSVEYGINFKTELSRLQYFDFCNGGLVPDIMHDVLEGVLKLEVKLLLQSLIYKSKYFTLEYLNGILEEFELGFMESSDRPSVIDSHCLKSTSDSLMAQSASQMWLLGRLLPTMIGCHVPEDDSNWENFLLLLRIMDYLFSPVITKEDCIYLKVIISDHHQMFVRLYQQVAVTPKLHFLIHMPRIILNYGPLVRLWSMRFEAKHQYFKRLSMRVNNFVRIDKTLAMRHQMLQLYYMMSPADEMQTGPVLPMEELHVQIFNDEIDSTCSKTKWVKLGGTLIQSPCALLWEAGDFPLFIQVNHILICKGIIYFYGPVLKTKYHSKHFHSLVLENVEEYKLIKDLHPHHPQPLHLRFSDSLCSTVVVPKHNICSV